MEIPSKTVYDVLVDNGVDTLYHANSVISSCQFLRNGALLSRGTVARNGWYQTPQSSDKTDRSQGVWFDVFVDSVDIHQRAKRKNVYGPVTFVLDAKIVKRTYTGKVWVTKLNPTKWAGRKHEQRWFTSSDDLRKNFVKGKFDQMIVFRHCGGELPFRKYLKEVMLDDCQLKTITKIDFYSMAYGALRLSITEGNLDIRIKKRRCPNVCKCVSEYSADKASTRKMYFPKI